MRRLHPLLESLDNSKKKMYSNDLQALIRRKHFIKILQKFLTSGDLVYLKL